MSGIAFLLGNLTDGGSETKTVRLANRLSKAGYDIHVVYLGEPHTLRSAIDDSVAVRFLDRRGKFSVRALRDFKSYVVSNDIDTVFCVNQYPLLYGLSACRQKDRERRCIGAMNAYELTSWRDRFSMLIYAFILRRCDFVLFGSNAQRQLWVQKYGIGENTSAVIYNGVDTEFFAPTATIEESAPLEVGEYDCVIGCVGHLRPEKSQIDLLAAMQRLVDGSDKKLLLLLVGEGPEEPAFRST